MTYTTIVVDASPAPSVRQTLEAAKAFAEAFGATLDVVSCAWPDTSLLAQALGSGNVASAQWQTQVMEEALQTTRHLGEQVMQGSQLESTWCSSVAEPVRVLCDHLFTADLAITGPGDRGPFCSADPTNLALRSGAPVLRLGREPSDTQFEHVLIAWKDCREARRAVHDALPILQAAKSVWVVGVGDEVTTDRLGALSQHLARHKVAAQPLHLARSEDGVCAQILRQAKTEGCGLIVSGAYSRNRHSERILGGVTRDLHADDQMSWYFAH